jgi:hypothetical protein
MREKFTAVTSLHKASYGHRLSELAPDPDRCCEEITVNRGGWPAWSQCSRPRGHGPEQAYCKQHDPDVALKRAAAVAEREKEAFQKRCLEWDAPRLLHALCRIADGHNDPRSIAAEVVARHRT